MGSFFNLTALRVGMLFAVSLLASGPCHADEIVIDESVNSRISIGDFDCSQCVSQISNSLNFLASDSTGELTAGDLWRFFDAQGIESMDRMTICLDLDPSESAQFGLETFEFSIEDPRNLGNLITSASLGNNSVVVPGYDISFHKPEAKFEIALGYDFMKRFSADSTEKVQFDFATTGSESSNPVFKIEGNSEFFSGDRNLLLLTGFVGFWVVVFVVFNGITRRSIRPDSTSEPVTHGRVLST